jgi:hypothetical protein
LKVGFSAAERSTSFLISPTTGGRGAAASYFTLTRVR